MKQTALALSLVAGALLVALPVSAQEASKTYEVSKDSELSIRAMLSQDETITGLFGGAGIAYRSGPAYLGGAGYGGPVVSKQRGGMGYGGVIVGATDTFGGAYYDARLLVGGGGGAIGENRAGSFAVEPSIALGVVLPGEAKLGLTAGYLYMPNASEFSGATLGLRFSH